ncbi:hypothetical protein Dsin_027047 [Dipteronia sinensis]|uniref:Alpha/beta hydrolase fold-3 domain-containing protein n=1 Tax=Dipteronia sinensis TaxID=43782 RepID=A0AAE0DYG0_9ROSI|nr:hypothetical protein Dsin_027047 [Dipteronia sinensis]
MQAMIQAQGCNPSTYFHPKDQRSRSKAPGFHSLSWWRFLCCSALGMRVKNVLTSLVSKANIMAISIEYRLAPEHPLPIAYEDSWAGLQWVATHSNGLGPELWLKDQADVGRVFLGG